MFTDPAKIKLNDKGHPDKCPVFMYHQTFNQDNATLGEIKKDCAGGKLGCVECKKRLIQTLDAFLGPIREKRRVYEKSPEKVDEILIEGTRKARKIASKTLEEVRTAMKINYFKG
jgi:tryptophanyl-tRNA synthetase